MNTEEAEKHLMRAGDEMASYAVAALAALTPGVHYTPQPMYDRIEQNLGQRLPESLPIKHLMIGVFALVNSGAVIAETYNRAELKIIGHSTRDEATGEWEETGDWEFDVERAHFVIEPDALTLEAVEALSGLPADELRPVLGRLIDSVQMTMVTSEATYENCNLGAAARILCGDLRKVINAGESVRLTGAVMRPGKADGYIVRMRVSRLGFDSEPRTEEGPSGP